MKARKKLISLLLCITMAVSLISCKKEDAAQETAADAVSREEEVLTQALDSQVSSSHSKDAGKEETVYVMADAKGAVNQIIVSDWIKNAEGSKELKDASDLKDIENVKGYETFRESSDGTMTWDAGGTDIYYQGTTQKELPVDVKISYTLDGEDISPEELAGKSGRVTIRFDYENKQKQKVEVNGEEEEIYTPFAMISGMVLPQDTFSNIEVTNARLISEGNNSLVIGLSFPGLKESLDVEGLKDKIEDKEKQEEFEDLEIPDYFEVSADATDFSLNMTMTMAMSDVLSDLNLTDNIDLSDINESMDDLQSASSELKDGTVDLKGGTSDLKEGTGKLKDGSHELVDGTNTLKNGTQELYDKSGDLDEGAGKLKDGSSELKGGTQILVTGTQALVTGSEQLDAGAAAIVQGLTTVDAAVAGLVSACEGTAVQPGLLQGTETLSDGMAGLDTLINTYFANYESTMNAQIKVAQTELASSNKMLKTAEQKLETAELEKEDALQKLNEVCQPEPASMPVNELETVSGNTVSEAAPASMPVSVVSPQKIKSALDDYQNAENGVSACSEEVASAKAKAESAQEMVNTIKQLTAAYMGTTPFRPDSTDPDDIKAAQAAAAQAATITMIKETSNKLAEGAETVNTGVNQVYGYLTQLHDAQKGVPALAAGAEKLKQGTAAAVVGTKELKDGAVELNDGAGTLQSGMIEFKDGTLKLINGTRDLNDGALTLKNGACDLYDGAQKLDDGAVILDDGAQKLKDGMFLFDEDGISRLTDLFGDNVQDAVDRIQAVMDAGKDYDTFTKLPEGVDGSVRFLYKTDAVKTE